MAETLPIPFPLLSAPGKTVQESGGRLENAYIQKAPADSAHDVIYRRSPGLRRLAQIPDHTGCRGLVTVGPTLIHVLGERVYTITEASGSYAAVNRGALAGTGRCTIAQNNANPVDTVAVTENGAFLLSTTSPPSSYPDGDLPTPNSVTELDGYLIYSTEGGEIWATAQNSTSVDSNSFEEVAERSLKRVVTHNGEVFAFGNWGYRVYRNAGTQPFVLAWNGVLRDVGIFGTHAVAGFQTHWPDELIFAGSDSRVYILDGYEPVPISNPDISRDLEAVTNRDAVIADAYVSEGEAFWTLTNPGHWTWEYNLTTGQWNERRSAGRNDWRGRAGVWAFDQWVIGDAMTGDIAQVTSSETSEYGGELLARIYSGIVHRFPMRVLVNHAYFWITGGVGIATGEDPEQTNPRVRIRWSLDGGATFGNPLERLLGSEGDYEKIVRVGRSGLSTGKGIQFCIEISDRVHVGFSQAIADVEFRMPR